jgi:hypothetical protein
VSSEPQKPDISISWNFYTTPEGKIQDTKTQFMLLKLNNICHKPLVWESAHETARGVAFFYAHFGVAYSLAHQCCLMGARSHTSGNSMSLCLKQIKFSQVR